MTAGTVGHAGKGDLLHRLRFMIQIELYEQLQIKLLLLGAQPNLQRLCSTNVGGIFCTQKKYPILLKLSLHRRPVYTKGMT